MTHNRRNRHLSGRILGQPVGGCFALMLPAAGCNQAPAPAPAPVDLKAAEDALRAGDAAQLKAAQAMDAAGTVAFYSDDATVMPDNQPLLSGKASIQKGWAAMLAPGMQLNWTPSKVEVAASGDLGYVQGTYTDSIPDADGKPVNDKGKYLEVWKKQADGSWKETEDTWNSDLPAVAAAPVKAKKGR